VWPGADVAIARRCQPPGHGGDARPGECVLLPWKLGSEKNYSIEDLVLLVRIYIASLEKYYSVQKFYFLTYKLECLFFAFVIYLCCKIVSSKLNCQIIIFFVCRPIAVGDQGDGIVGSR
jgi:hypothetical protein